MVGCSGLGLPAVEWRSAMSEIERQRDAALIGYNECRATIEDARRALGATAHEGLLLAAMRVTEQRDRLAEALESVKCELGVPQPEYPSPVANAYWIADDALQSQTTRHHRIAVQGWGCPRRMERREP